MTILSARNDRLADAYLAAVLHRDPEVMLLTIVEAAQAGGTRNVLDLLDAVGASARDVIDQLGADQAEAHLRRRLLVAAIEDANHHPKGSSTTVSMITLKALAERHHELNDQLATLLSQHADITRDLQLAGQDWQTALRAGEDVTLPAERRRHRQAELDENAEAVAQVRAWVEEVEAERRRRAPQQQLDGDLAQLATDIRSYDQNRAQLEGAHLGAIDKVIDAAQELQELVWTTRQDHDELATRAQTLRATAVQLDRPDVTVPAPGSWSQHAEQALHGTGAPWRVYLTSVQNRAVEPLARALGDAAAVTLIGRGQTATATDRALRHRGIR